MARYRENWLVTWVPLSMSSNEYKAINTHTLLFTYLYSVRTVEFFFLFFLSLSIYLK